MKSTSKILQPVNEENILQAFETVENAVKALENGGGGSGSGAISLTFSQLQSAISGGALIVGQSYLITDYETRHKIDGVDDLNDNNSIEPILCIASSNNNIFRQVYSPSNPNDIIFWDYTDVQCENIAQTPRTGKIIYRKDVINNIETFWDFRKVQIQTGGGANLLSIPVEAKNIKVAKCSIVNYTYNNLQIANNANGLYLTVENSYSIDFRQSAIRNTWFYTSVQNLQTGGGGYDITDCYFYGVNITGQIDNSLRSSAFYFFIYVANITQQQFYRVFDMQSPDGSLWANDIDNSGVVTTVKLQ